MAEKKGEKQGEKYLYTQPTYQKKRTNREYFAECLIHGNNFLSRGMRRAEGLQFIKYMLQYVLVI